MDLNQLMGTALGGALAIAGGAVAVLLTESKRREAAKRDRQRDYWLRLIRDTRQYFNSYQDHLVEHLQGEPKSGADAFSAHKWEYLSLEIVGHIGHLQQFHSVAVALARQPRGSGIPDLFSFMTTFDTIRHDLDAQERRVLADEPPRLVSEGAMASRFDMRGLMAEAYRDTETDPLRPDNQPVSDAD